MIGRLVAIKLFPKELASGEARQRFIQEARVVGQLSHPSIITLHDMGIDEATQTPYLVMEYLEGQPLDRILDKGSVPFPRACAWAAEVACALGVAHRKGVIHGDVKPANMLITDDGRLKLMDFGMARLASHEDRKSTRLNSSHANISYAVFCLQKKQSKPAEAERDASEDGEPVELDEEQRNHQRCLDRPQAAGSFVDAHHAARHINHVDMRDGR